MNTKLRKSNALIARRIAGKPPTDTPTNKPVETLTPGTKIAIVGQTNLRAMVHDCGFELSKALLEHMLDAGINRCPNGACGGKINFNQSGGSTNMAKNEAAPAAASEKAAKPAKETIKVKKGSRVEHKLHGPGTVLEVPGYKPDYPNAVKVQFDNGTTKRYIGIATLTESDKPAPAAAPTQAKASKNGNKDKPEAAASAPEAPAEPVQEQVAAPAGELVGAGAGAGTAVTFE